MSIFIVRKTVHTLWVPAVILIKAYTELFTLDIKSFPEISIDHKKRREHRMMRRKQSREKHFKSVRSKLQTGLESQFAA